MPPSWRYALQLAQEAANAPPVHPVHTPVGGGWASVADLLFVQSAPTEAPRAMQSGVAPLPAGLTPAAAVRGGGALGAGQAVQPPDGVDGGMRVELPRPGEGLAADALCLVRPPLVTVDRGPWEFALGGGALDPRP